MEIPCAEWAYALTSSKDLQSKAGEKHLLEFLELIRQRVEKAASVNETSFFSSFEAFGTPKTLKPYTHAQYEGCGNTGTYGCANQASGTEDDHHSPLSPEIYLKLRMEPQMRFYQSRLPTYYRTRTISEVLLMIGTLSGTLMAFLDVSEWAAVVTAVATLVTAWVAFHGTSRKLTRYSNTVSKGLSILLWWKHMTPIEKSSVTNVNQLVMICEDLFERERESWQSTSMATKLLTDAAAATSGSAQEDDDSDKGSQQATDKQD